MLYYFSGTTDEGKVIDSNGNPVADARVSTWLKGGGYWKDVTGEDGTFIFDGIYPTEAIVSVRHHRLGSKRFEAVPVDTLQVLELMGE
jgi:protocatechuate 3,4-dioxygenase beta subunit